MRNKQLVFARQYRCETQKSLCEKVSGLSQPNLSKYVKGLGGLSDDTLARAMGVLLFPVSFLDLKIENKVENCHFRKRSTINQGDKNMIEHFISIVAYIYDWMLENLEAPAFNFQCMDVNEGYSPETAAKQIRRKFRLGTAPIANIVNLLELNGVSVYAWDCPYENFDGVSLITDKGNHLVIVNKNMSNDRIRNTLAHELGHIILHLNTDFAISDYRDKENEANRFASELLMPESELRNSLFNLQLSALSVLKRYWMVSMQSLIYRAQTLNSIDKDRYTYLMTEMSRLGWRKREPVEVHWTKQWFSTRCLTCTGKNSVTHIKTLQIPHIFLLISLIQSLKVMPFCVLKHKYKSHGAAKLPFFCPFLGSPTFSLPF